MFFKFVKCKHNNRYILLQEGTKHWDFRIIGPNQLMSPLTGELLPNHLPTLLNHIKQYAHITPVNRPM